MRKERLAKGWPRRGGQREHRRRKGVERCRDTTEPVRWELDRARDEAWGVANERPRRRDP
jgi:hypothetical protein